MTEQLLHTGALTHSFYNFFYGKKFIKSDQFECKIK